MQTKVRWTSKEWDLVLRRMAKNKNLFRSMKERIADGVTALPPERRRDPLSVSCSSAPWKKDLLALEKEMADELEHIQGDTTPPPAPIDLTKVPDKEFYAEAVRRLGLFVLQNSPSALLSLVAPPTKSTIPGDSGLPPLSAVSSSPEVRSSQDGDLSSSQSQSVGGAYVPPRPGGQNRPLPKVVFIGVYGKNAATLKAKFDPYMRSSFFDPDSKVASVQAACTAADVVFICVERIPHNLKDAIASLKGKKEIHYQKGGTSALERDVSARFNIPQDA